MRGWKNCKLCAEKPDFNDHLVMLALGHLMVEYFPKDGFSEDEIIEKARILSANITRQTIHKNLEIISEQLQELKEV